MKRRGKRDTTWNIPRSIKFSHLHFILYRGKSIAFGTVYNTAPIRSVAKPVIFHLYCRYTILFFRFTAHLGGIGLILPPLRPHYGEAPCRDSNPGRGPHLLNWPYYCTHWPEHVNVNFLSYTTDFIWKQRRRGLYRILCERLRDLVFYLALYMTDKSCENGHLLRIRGSELSVPPAIC